MTKLTPAQQALLTRAAADARGHVEAGPTNANTAKALIKRGWLISLPQPQGPSQLLITEAGRAALGVSAAMPPELKPEPEPAPEPATPKGKLGQLVELLRAPGGATIEAMSAATGWQAHSVRGALAGSLKKKLGLAVVSEKTDAGRVYRIIQAGAGA